MGKPNACHSELDDGYYKLVVMPISIKLNNEKGIKRLVWGLILRTFILQFMG